MGTAILDAGIGELGRLVALPWPDGRGVAGGGAGDVGLSLTFSALSWVLGFLLLMRFLSERMASFGWTVLDLMMSEISRLRAISSLWTGNRVSSDASRAS